MVLTARSTTHIIVELVHICHYSYFSHTSLVYIQDVEIRMKESVSNIASIVCRSWQICINPYNLQYIYMPPPPYHHMEALAQGVSTTN